MLPVALIAGGLATRLKLLTEDIPKSMIRVAGRPFIDWQLIWLKSQGIEDVIICAGHFAAQLKNHVGKGENFGLQVRYSFDGPTQLGTGGALKKALPLLGDYFYVLYGDSLLPVDLLPIEDKFFQNDRTTLMAVIKNQDRWDKSNVEYSDGRVIHYNKKNPTKNMEFIDYGISVLNRNSFTDQKFGAIFDLADVYKDLSKQGNLLGYEVFDRFYEVGSIDGIRQTESYLKSRGSKWAILTNT